jgi:hypothetical protein
MSPISVALPPEGNMAEGCVDLEKSQNWKFVGEE